MTQLRARTLIRDIPDFPQPGILFKDITPILNDADAYQEVIDALVEQTQEHMPDAIAGIESRGFLFGAPLALCLGIGFIPIRKAGKLPYKTLREEYALEYGTNVMEMHEDGVLPGQRILIIDDLLATGGTARAAARLVERASGIVSGITCVVELSFLNGREKLSQYELSSLISFS